MSQPQPAPKLTRAESSRINGAKSRGPKTAAGKCRSRANALRHGFTATTLARPVSSPECEAYFAERLAAWNPATPELHAIALLIFGHEWDLARIRKVQSDLLNPEMEVQRSLHHQRGEAPLHDSQLFNRAFLSLLGRRSGLRSAVGIEAGLQNALFRGLSLYFEYQQQLVKFQETT